jgi:alpha-glucosidase
VVEAPSLCFDARNGLKSNRLAAACGSPYGRNCRALIELRKATPQLGADDYVSVASTGDLPVYRREYEGKALLIVLNLGADPISIGSDTMAFPGEILLSTNLDRIGETVSGGLDLCGDEGLIIRLQ